MLTNMEMAASCMDRVRTVCVCGGGGDILCMQLFIGYEEKGDAWGRTWERGGEYAAQVFEAIQRSLFFTAVELLLQNIYSADGYGKEKVRKNS